jgi:outer membrane cobalamin receptor
MLNCCLLSLFLFAQFDASNMGELRITVNDPAGLPVQGRVEVVSEANQIRRSLTTDVQGKVTARQLPFGTYEVKVSLEGFAPFSGIAEIRSATPLPYLVTLGVAMLQSQVEVTGNTTLVDPGQTGAANRIGRTTIESRTLSAPGRALPELVSTQPGWLLEANGVLHPRGSEYQTQYIIDGLPLTDNRSPSFAPEIDADGVQSMGILTGGFPAEYGRKLGGIIEVITAEDSHRGFRSGLTVSGGSFATRSAEATAQYGWENATVTASAAAAATDRYLDPPVEENYSNHGTTNNAMVRLDRALGTSDRFGLIVRHGGSSFLVPNERIQQEGGQRQSRTGHETVAQYSYQHLFTSPMVWDVRGMTRTLSATLRSNASSTPIRANQDRGLRETYVRATLSGHRRNHEWKVGGDAEFGNVREEFDYQISAPSEFERGTPLRFSFDDRARDREQSLFAQDQIAFGRLTVSAGIRWDRYAFLVNDTAFSPRVAAAWSVPRHDLVLRASYDRAFQTPSIENLLLASSESVETLSDETVRLPVPPSRGNFFEGGLTKGLWHQLRADVTIYRRNIDDFADDDVLLNTGVSFPISFRRAEIRGAEAKLTVPAWRGFSGYMSYAYMTGIGFLPVNGGLLLGDEVEALDSTDRFVITQDQRNTAAGRLSYQLTRATVSLNAAYGSGLPVEFDGNEQEAIEQFGERVVSRVNFERGRVRPSLTIDASVSVFLTSARNIRIQADVLNLTNELRVINFSGVFSGTAIGAPRSAAVRLLAQF